MPLSSRALPRLLSRPACGRGAGVSLRELCPADKIEPDTGKKDSSRLGESVREVIRCASQGRRGGPPLFESRHACGP